MREASPAQDGADVENGRELDGRTWDEMPGVEEELEPVHQIAFLA